MNIYSVLDFGFSLHTLECVNDDYGMYTETERNDIIVMFDAIPCLRLDNCVNCALAITKHGVNRVCLGYLEKRCKTL